MYAARYILPIIPEILELYNNSTWQGEQSSGDVQSHHEFVHENWEEIEHLIQQRRNEILLQQQNWELKMVAIFLVWALFWIQLGKIFLIRIIKKFNCNMKTYYEVLEELEDDDEEFHFYDYIAISPGR